MNQTFLENMIELLRRASVLGVVLFLCLPAAQASALSGELVGFLGGQSVCFDSGGKGIAQMTPDARAFQMSIEIAKLQHMLAESDAQDAPVPCDVDAEGGEELCSLADPIEQDGDEGVRFVPASLLEDIVPLLPDAPSDYSCSSSSSGPDRCESYPPLPERLHLDVSFSSVHMRAPSLLPAPREYSFTRALVKARPFAQHEASGFVRLIEIPPQV